MDAEKKNELIQKYIETVNAKDELLDKLREGQLTLEEAEQLTKLNEEQYMLVAQMIDLQLIQIHISEE